MCDGQSMRNLDPFYFRYLPAAVFSTLSGNIAILKALDSDCSFQGSV